MHFSRILFGIAVAAGLAIAPTARLSPDQAPPVNVPGIDKPVIVVTGDVASNESWVNTNYYVLRGAVFVRSGSTLNIAAGTRIIGEAGSVGTLIVERGGRLNAIGTPTAPIVFTSDQPVGQRGRGDWGGIIINGRAPLNFGSGEATGEGDTGVYGGTDPNDNSGTLQYVRVEFSGVEFSPDNELNGIAFQAVGRGTVVHHVQAHMSRDDALEWFGGTVDGKYMVVSNAADDAVDWTFGWTGRLQFVAVTQRGDDADNGIEADNNEFNNNVLPRSNPQIYNITLCGDPDRNEGGESPRGVRTSGAGRHLRSGTSWSPDSRPPGSRSATARRSPRSTTELRRWVPVWRGTLVSPAALPSRRCTRACKYSSTAVASRTSERTSIPACRRPPARTTLHRTSNLHRSPPWLVVSLRPSCRPMMGFSK